MTLNVIDVSRYQAGINMPALKAAGCHAIIVGSTYGTAGINPAAFAQLDGAKAAGLLRGVYHIRARQNTTAIQEANYFLDNVRGYLDGSTIPVLDWEECDTSDETWALAWLNEVYRQTGVRPWFYVNLGDILTYKYPRIAAAGYAIWLASYPYNTVDGFQGVNWTPQALPAGHTLVAWQYVGSGGSLAGYTGLDLSVGYLDTRGWAAYATPIVTGQSTTTTTIPQKDWFDMATKEDVKAAFREVLAENLSATAAAGQAGTYAWAIMNGRNHAAAVDITTAHIGAVVEENQRRINTANAGIANAATPAPTPVTLTDAQLRQITATIPPATLVALSALAAKLA